MKKIMRLARDLWHDASGVILPYVTLMLVVIVGLSLLALDGARYMSLQTQMQAAADAMALAGAAELNGKSGARARATKCLRKEEVRAHSQSASSTHRTETAFE